VVVIEYGVVVAHPTFAEYPELGVIRNNTANAVGARPNWSPLERGSRQGKVLASNSERNGREGCIARESIEARITSNIRGRAWDLVIELRYCGVRTNDER
jgi:hypothetical protein